MEDKNIKPAFKVNDKYFDSMEEAILHSNGLNQDQYQRDQYQRDQYQRDQYQRDQYQRDQYQRDLDYIANVKRDIRDKVKELYERDKIDLEACNCGKIGDYSEVCTKHLCTCNTFNDKFADKVYDRYICDYHTNLEFRNKGCFWCRSRDCSKFYC
jgi:hypothetical protein